MSPTILLLGSATVTEDVELTFPGDDNSFCGISSCTGPRERE